MNLLGKDEVLIKGGFQKSFFFAVKHMKLEKFFTKLGQNPQKSCHLGEFGKNCTISGNHYFLVQFQIVLYQGSY